MTTETIRFDFKYVQLLNYIKNKKVSQKILNNESKAPVFVNI